jgi:hypothetical protein
VNLNIPRPVEEVPHKLASEEDIAKVKNLKKKGLQKPVPTPTAALTPWLVFLWHNLSR